jgi:hypothetical protein
MKKNAADSGRLPSAVRVAGATGYNAAVVNGIYEPTSEMCGKTTLPKFVKISDENQTLEYVAGALHGGYWASKGKDSPNVGESAEQYGQAYCRVKSKGLPEDCTVGKWDVGDSNCYKASDFSRQASVTVSIVSPAEVEAHRAFVAAEAAREVVGTRHVRLVGPTGPFDRSFLKGVFEPTAEVFCGVTVYCNLETEYLLEYHSGTGQWQVKPVACKGANIGFARCAVPAKCLPEECPVDGWLFMVDGEMYQMVPEALVTVAPVSPQEAEASVLQTVATALNISVAAPPPSLGPRLEVEPVHIYLRKDGRWD